MSETIGNKKVSIILSVYNGEQHIYCCKSETWLTLYNYKEEPHLNEHGESCIQRFFTIRC